MMNVGGMKGLTANDPSLITVIVICTSQRETEEQSSHADVSLRLKKLLLRCERKTINKNDFLRYAALISNS